METAFAPPFSLKGEIVLVTGGGTGLGLAITRCMVSAGADVVITGRHQVVLDEAAAALGPGVTPFVGDITQLESLPRLVGQVEAQVGPLSILVNNAGIHLKKSALETSDQEFANVIQTHVFASFALARAAAKVMLARKKGSIIFIGSMAGLLGIPEVSAYSTAKAAVVGLTRSLAAEWSEHGIRVNAIVPGWIDTGMASQALNRDPQRKAKILSRTPVHHLGDGEDVGWAAVYLCSPAAKFVTGSILTVDGGAAIGF